jgi:hypothetical protein
MYLFRSKNSTTYTTRGPAVVRQESRTNAEPPTLDISLVRENAMTPMPQRLLTNNSSFSLVLLA